MGYLIAVLYFSVASTFANNVPVSNEEKIDSNLTWRLVEPEKAPDGEYPYMVSIREASFPDMLLCGGIIISEKIILTAANCVISYFFKDYIVIAGTNHRVLHSDGETYKVLDVVFNMLFNSTEQLHDVAILKVEYMRFHDKVNRIQLEETFVGGGVNVTLSGWSSALVDGLTVNDDLQHLSYKTITVEQCRKRVIGRSIEDTQICTKTENGVGLCHIYPGSALIRSVNGVRYLVGIASYGIKCEKRHSTDVYSRVSSLIPWINEQMLQIAINNKQ